MFMGIKLLASFPGFNMSFYHLIELVFWNGICIFHYGKTYIEYKSIILTFFFSLLFSGTKYIHIIVIVTLKILILK